MRFSKGDLLSMFERQERSYLLAISATHWMRGGDQFAPPAAAFTRGLAMQVRDLKEWREFGDVADCLEGAERYAVVGDFMLNQLHALIRVPFETVRAYCDDYDAANVGADLKRRMKASDWYWFAYFIRNAISHDFHFRFEANRMKHLPAHWRGRTLSASLHGKPLTDEHLGHRPGFDLFLDMRDFASSLP